MVPLSMLFQVPFSTAFVKVVCVAYMT